MNIIDIDEKEWGRMLKIAGVTVEDVAKAAHRAATQRIITDGN